MQSFIHKEYFDKGDVITTDIIKFKKQSTCLLSSHNKSTLSNTTNTKISDDFYILETL